MARSNNKLGLSRHNVEPPIMSLQRINMKPNDFILEWEPKPFDIIIIRISWRGGKNATKYF